MDQGMESDLSKGKCFPSFKQLGLQYNKLYSTIPLQLHSSTRSKFSEALFSQAMEVTTEFDNIKMILTLYPRSLPLICAGGDHSTRSEDSLSAETVKFCTLVGTNTQRKPKALDTIFMTIDGRRQVLGSRVVQYVWRRI